MKTTADKLQAAENNLEVSTNRRRTSEDQLKTSEDQLKISEDKLKEKHEELGRLCKENKDLQQKCLNLSSTLAKTRDDLTIANYKMELRLPSGSKRR